MSISERLLKRFGGDPIKTKPIDVTDPLGVRPAVQEVTQPTISERIKTKLPQRLGGEVEETSPALGGLPFVQKPTPISEISGQPITGTLGLDRPTEPSFVTAAKERFPEVTPTTEQLQARESREALKTQIKKQGAPTITEGFKTVKIGNRDVEASPQAESIIQQYNDSSIFERINPKSDINKQITQLRQQGEIKDLATILGTRAEEKAGATEFIRGLAPTITESVQTPEVQQQFDITQQVSPLGQVTGKLTGAVGSFTTASSLINSLGTASKLGQLLGGSKLAKFAGTQVADLIVDTVAQAPGEILTAIREEKTLEQTVKDGLEARALDAVINLALGGVSEAFKAIKSAPSEEILKSVGTTPEDLETAVKTNDTALIDRVRGQLREKTLVERTREGLGFETKAVVEPDSVKSFTPGGTVSAPPETLIKDVPVDTTAKVLTDLPDKVKTNLGDRFDRVYQELVSTNLPFERIGGKARTQASNINRVQGAIEYNVVGKQTDMLGNEIGKSVVEIFEDVPKESKQELFNYIFHKHNIDRATQGKPVFGDLATAKQSAKIVADFEAANPTALAKQQEISGYFKNLLNDWGVSSGLVSQETSDFLADIYKNYVPTLRAKNLPKALAQGNQTVSQIIKKAKGGEDAILPLDQMMIMHTDRIIKNARRNELLNTVAEGFEQGTTGKFVKDVTISSQEAVDDLIDIGKSMEIEPVLRGNEYIINFYKDGKPATMTVNKTLFKALEQANNDAAINAVAGTVKKYATQPFKNLITGYNPIFAASNIMRDVPTALTYSSNPLKMVGEVPEAVKEMLTNGEAFRQFKALGGTREGLIGSGKTFKVPNLGESSAVMDQVKKLNPVKTIGDINNFTETLPRFSEYLNVLKETGDPALAIYKSAELTTDFARNGNLTKLLDNFVPYLNPSVQGVDKFFRNFAESPLKKIGKGATVITIPTLILDQINKDNEAYNNLSPRERNLFFQIPYTDPQGEQKFIRVPKSRELGVAFSSIAEWASRAARGQEVTGEEIAQAVKENFTPTDITAPIWTPALKAWNQIKDPEAYETNFWGGLIVPESQRRFSPGEQYDLNSSGIAKAIGQQFEISPFVVDYLIKSYGGIIGQTVQPIGADRVTSPLAPLEKKFITDPVFKDDSITQFYEFLDEKRKEAQDFNKQNNVPSEIVTPLEKQASQAGKIATQLSNIRKQQRELQQKKDQESKDKIRELQEVMNEIAKKAIGGQ